MWILAEVLKPPTKFDCLKHPSVLALESFDLTPFHLVSLLLFALAIFHTLFVYKIHEWAKKWEERQGGKTLFVHFLSFLSQVEVVFAFWAIPLFIAICSFYTWEIALEYINTRDYTEPLFVVVILSLTATRPVIVVAERAIKGCANLLGGSLSAWWMTLLTIGPLLGSVITEVGSMTVCALLLSRQFYIHQPSQKLAYATLALLFANVSVGGVLTDFASPAVLVLAHCWDWNTLDMLQNFGWKAALGIFLANLLYWIYFRQEMRILQERRAQTLSHAKTDSLESQIPSWVTCIHLLLLAWIVLVSHYPAVFIASFLFFVGFHQATYAHQYPIRLAHPMLVGLFLAGLVIHGGLQGWWVLRLLQDLQPLAVMGVSMSLTAFNDNTAISYLASLIPNWGKIFEYAVFTGVLAGGGLTVIANAPNPAGYAILQHHFPEGIQPSKLFLAALLPTLLLYAVFFFFGPLF